MGLSVKLYLPDGTVRRFPFNDAGSMNDLRAKILTMHPELQGYDICWKDADGDYIVLTNQEDLAEGLRHMENDLLRLFAKLRGQTPASTPRTDVGDFSFIQAPPTPQQEPMQERNVENEAAANDQEQDQQEETQNQDEGQQEGQGNWRKWREGRRAAREAFHRQQQENPDLHIGVTCDGCECEVRGIRYKCATCADYDLCEKCEVEKKHPEHALIKITTPEQGYDMRRMRGFRRFQRHAHGCPPPPPPFFGGHFAHCGPMRGGRRHWERCGADCKSKDCGWRAPPGFNAQEWNQWFSGISDEVRANIPPPPPLNTTAAVWNDWLKGLIRGFQNMGTGDTTTTGEGTSAEAKKEEGKQTEEDKSREAAYLYQVGDQIAAILRGFGIQVDVNVEERENEPANQEAPKEKNANETPVKEAAGQEPMETGAQQEGEKETTPVRETEWTFVHNEAEATAPAPEAGATAATAETLNPEVQQEAATATEPGAAPELSPKVATALQHMQNMGFTNDGGWLTALLVNKDGDISAVLDVLQRGPRA